jgi:hypothetical protein
MRVLRTVATALALSLAAMSFAAPASADADDAVIAGAAGFAVGTLFGAASRPYYGPRAYYRPGAYYRRAPVYGYRVLRPRWYASCRGQRSSSGFNKGNFIGYGGTNKFCY